MVSVTEPAVSRQQMGGRRGPLERIVEGLVEEDEERAGVPADDVLGTLAGHDDRFVGRAGHGGDVAVCMEEQTRSDRSFRVSIGKRSESRSGCRRYKAIQSRP